MRRLRTVLIVVALLGILMVGYDRWLRVMFDAFARTYVGLP